MFVENLARFAFVHSFCFCLVVSFHSDRFIFIPSFFLFSSLKREGINRDGRDGAFFIKRFNVTSITRDREYDLTRGKPGSRVAYFTANPNGEAEVIKVSLKPNPKLKRIYFDKSFSDIMIKGRSSLGNLLTKLDVERIGLKSHGSSTLGGRKVWFDHDVKRLNYDDHGQYLGEFHSEDLILVILDNGEFYTTNFDLNNHYEQNILRIEKFDAQKVWTAALFDADQGFPYLKRFSLEATVRHQNLLGENPESRLLLLSDVPFPRLLVTYGAPDDFREPMEIDAEQFIGQKSYKAKGKRITTLSVASIEELEPTRFPEGDEEPEGNEDLEDSEDSEGSVDFENIEVEDNAEEAQEPVAADPDHPVIDPITGQFNLFEE